MKKTKGQAISFCVDTRLRITSWDEEDNAVAGRSAAVGRKYHEVFPRILKGNEDALSMVLKSRRGATLRRYPMLCLNGRIMTDIRLKPLKAENGTAKGVEVVISADSTCSSAARLQNLRRIIDIGKTAATLAHGVRSPLNAIKGAVLYLRERYSQEPTLIEFTKIMEDEISQLDKFVSRFLSTTLSVDEVSEVDLNALLRRVELLTSLQAQTKNISCTYEYGDIPPIMINAFQLEQAILNIVNNAIEAMGSPGELVLKTKREQIAGDEYIVIEISDTGRGMDGKDAEKLSLSTEQRKKGKGFGLFLTREMMQFYGGRFEIKSRKGAGTTARLLLPLKNLKRG